MHPQQRLARRARGALRSAWLVGLFLAVPRPAAAPAVRRDHPSPGGGPAGQPIIRVVRVGTAPGLLTVDTRTQRVFVLNYATNSVGDSIGRGTVSVLDAGSGALVRTVPIGQNPADMIVDVQTNRVFVTSDGSGQTNALLPYAPHGHVSVLDARTGRLLHTAPVGYSPGALAIDNRTHHVFVVNGGTLSTLDATRGTVINTIPSTSDGMAAVSERSEHVFITNYEPSQVSIANTRTGRIIRTIRIGDHPGPIAVDDQTGHVFTVNETSGVFNDESMLDVRSGVVLRTTAVGAFPRMIVVDARTQRVFVLNANSVSTLDARSGGLLHTAAVDHFQGQTGGMALDAGAGRLYVTSDRGLLVLDARSGALLDTVPVGGAAGAIAVDARTQRVFIADSARNSVTILDATRLP